MRLRTDEQLLAAFRAGSESAFAAIHDRYRQRLFSYARQMLGGSRQDAEDVLQDVLLSAYATLRADGRAVTLRAWLYRVAHNRCVDHIRRPAPAPVEIADDTPSQSLSASLHDPLASAQRREELARLVVDILRLPAQQRSALLMREIDGMGYGELAGALEVSVPAVKSLLVRARMGLAEAGEARDAACRDIRADLADSHDRGVRVSGHARRHLRDCEGCAHFRVALRATSAGMGALMPGGAGGLAGLTGAIGPGASGAAAAASGAGGLSAAWSAGTVTKVAALAGAAAIAAGGAGEVSQRLGGGAAGGSHGEAQRTVRAPEREVAPLSPGDPAGTGSERRAEPGPGVAAASAGRVVRRRGAERPMRTRRERAGDRRRTGERVSSSAPEPPPAATPPSRSGLPGLIPAVVGGLLGGSTDGSPASPEPEPAPSGSDAPADDQAAEPAGEGPGGRGAPEDTRSGEPASDGAGRVSP